MPITTLTNYTEDGNNMVFDSRYKDSVFLLWYSSGKPPIVRLRGIINSELGVDTIAGRIPGIDTLRNWIEKEFTERALSLDQEVDRQMQEQVVQQKVEMLRRHAEIAKTMQSQALDYLSENGLGNSKNALAALINGLKIERDSVGVIPFFEKLGDMSDDALMLQLQKLASKTPVSIEAFDGDDTN